MGMGIGIGIGMGIGMEVFCDIFVLLERNRLNELIDVAYSGGVTSL